MIVICNGPPGSGKDAACLFFQEIGYKHLSFKDKLFSETIKYFNVSSKWFMEGYFQREIKERPDPLLKVDGKSLSRREAMIYVSEKYIKPRYGKGYFGDALSNSIDKNFDYCVSDGGFEEELLSVINKIGTENITLIQLTRDGCDFSSDSRKYFNGKLIEEYVLNKKTDINDFHFLPRHFDIRTYRVHNNGTIDEFRETLKKIHEKESDVKSKKTKTDTC